MYTSCLFCNGSLGRNEAIEYFPVGRRLAFDAAKGRLWVVCPRCARWNLTPLDARWEAIEEAERAYRDTKLRSATDNIGLAKLREGTELVRIGRPLLPEFASWRYGDVFRGRHRRATALGVLGIAAPLTYTALSMGGAAHALGVSASVAGIVSSVYMWGSVAVQLQAMRRRVVIRNDDGRLKRLSVLHVARSEIVRNADGKRWWIRIVHPPRTAMGRVWQSFSKGHLEDMEEGWSDVSGEPARRALATLLPVANRGGATAVQLTHAVNLVSGVSDPAAMIIGEGSAPGSAGLALGVNVLGGISPAYRLAMEMALHESDERRAMEGELAELDARWREAEEIAAISDSLFTPESVERRLAALRRRD